MHAPQDIPGPSWAPGHFQTAMPDGRIRCDLCPRECRLRDGQAGACLVRRRHRETIYLTAYGLASGFAVDPIEKKPLFHFMPGSRILSFGSAGCNLACRFCQNWHISKRGGPEVLSQAATPDDIAHAAIVHGCRSVAFTYNEPVITHEFVVDTARACREVGVRTVAVTAGYISARAAPEFFASIDAANVDLKAFSDAFYRRNCAAKLGPVLEALRYVRTATKVWLEITCLLIPGENDGPDEIDGMTRWVRDELGGDTPIHFSAFHPAWKMLDHPRTPVSTIEQACLVARENGLRYVYSGNVRDEGSQSTWCPGCGACTIRRRGFATDARAIDQSGRCTRCGTAIPGAFDNVGPQPLAD